MKKLKKYIFQLFCDHEDQKCITTLDDNYINKLSLGIKMNHTTWVCERCGKVIYKPLKEKYYPLTPYLKNWE